MRTRFKNQNGVTLIELLMYTALSSLVIATFGSIFMWISDDFKNRMAENEAQLNLMEASYALKRSLSQARLLDGADDLTGALTNVFNTTSSDGIIATGPNDRSAMFDSYSIPDTPANQGKYFFVAKYEREESTANPDLAYGDSTTRYSPTAIYYRTPNRSNTVPPAARSGALVIAMGPRGAVANVDIEPKVSDLLFNNLSRLRIKSFDNYPSNRRITSVTFEITIRYFPTSVGRRDYWLVLPPPAVKGEATYKDISRDVTVVIRNNLLDNTGGLIKASGQVRPYSGLYFFKTVSLLNK